MRKIAKLLTVAVVAAAGAFFTLNNSNEIICGNIEALTGGDTGSSGPESVVVTKGRKATNQECEDSKKPLLGITLPNGFSQNAAGTHTIDGTTYNDCGTYTYGFVIYDDDYGKCVGWYQDCSVGGIGPMGNWRKCPEHP